MFVNFDFVFKSDWCVKCCVETVGDAIDTIF